MTRRLALTSASDSLCACVSAPARFCERVERAEHVIGAIRGAARFPRVLGKCSGNCTAPGGRGGSIYTYLDMVRRIPLLCKALVLLFLSSCAPVLSAPPAAKPEARNGPTQPKKPRKVTPPPVLAPPPGYGNKIVRSAGELEPSASHPAEG